MDCHLQDWCMEELEGFWHGVPDRCRMCNSRVRMIIMILHYARRKYDE